jgi:BCD family chlorophyll transporter-like MFS transporter
MTSLNDRLARQWGKLGPRFLPFADAASAELPLGRMLRLSLFQVSVGMALVLLNGTLNRVMIVELGVSASLVAGMLALPVLIAPFRTLLGFRSDNHRSFLGWRRVPYIWFGTLLQFGGLSILPFALIVLSGDSNGPEFVAYIATALAFLLVGAGLHATQTAGLALACDLAPPDKQHRVVAVLYVMLLIGMVVSSLMFSLLLAPFSQVRLIQVIQGAAAVTMILNIVALWKQEARAPHKTSFDRPMPTFRETWRKYSSNRRALRPLVALGLGTAGFSMQDILLEPFGGEILHMSVSSTTLLTAILSLGTLAGLAFAARALGGGMDPYRLAALGALIGVPALSAVVFSVPLESPGLFRTGAFLIGVGGGLFTIATLTAAMRDATGAESGLALGAWGAVQATAAGAAIAFSGLLRDSAFALGASGALGPALNAPSTGYMIVYHVEIALLFACLVVIGPLVGSRRSPLPQGDSSFGMAELPG